MKKRATYTGVIAGVAFLATLSTIAVSGVNAYAAAPSNTTNAIDAAQAFAGTAVGKNSVNFLGSAGIPSAVNTTPSPDSWGNFILTQDSLAPQFAAGNKKPSAYPKVDNVYGVGAAEFGNTVDFSHDFTLTYAVASTNVSGGQGDGLVFVPSAAGQYTKAMQGANDGGAGIAGLPNAVSFFHQANVTANSTARNNGAWTGSNAAKGGYSSFRYTDSTGTLVPATSSSFSQTSASGAKADWANAASGSAWDDQYNGNSQPVQYTVQYTATNGQLTVTQTNGTYNPGESGFGFVRGGIIGSLVNRYLGTITAMGNGAAAGAVAGVAGAKGAGLVANTIGWGIGLIPVVLFGWIPFFSLLGDAIMPPIVAAFYGVEAIANAAAAAAGSGVGALVGGTIAQNSVKKGFEPALNVFGNTKAPTMLGLDPKDPNVLGVPSDTVYTTTIPTTLRADSYTVALVAAKGSASSAGNSVGASTNQLEITNYAFGK